MAERGWPRRWVLLAALGIALASCLHWHSLIPASPVIQGDASHSMRMALNLARHGTLSMNESAPYEPTMYREPVPSLPAALAIRLIDAAGAPPPASAFFQGNAARRVLLVNLGWMVLLALCVFAGTWTLTGSNLLSLGGMLLVNLRIPATASSPLELGVDDLTADLPGAVLLVAASVMLALAYSRPSRHWALGAGLTLGLLALTKAAALYVALGVVAVCFGAAALAVAARRRPPAQAFALPALLLAGLAASVLPWMLRNQANFDRLAIAERGGVVLLMRAHKDAMNPTELRGAFYFWAPPKLQPLVGRLLGFGPADLQRGGRLQRLNRNETADFYEDDLAAELAGRPDLTLTYYRTARAERVLEEKRFAQLGDGASAAADAVLQRRALDMIRADVPAHLATTPAFIWRGAPLALPLLLLAGAVALWRRHFALAWFVLPSLGLLGFYALLSHFLLRYAAPVAPALICAGLALLHLGWTEFASSARRAGSGPGSTWRRTTHPGR